MIAAMEELQARGGVREPETEAPLVHGAAVPMPSSRTIR